MNEKQKISRHQFLQIIAVSGAAGVAFKFGFESLTADQVISETRLLMGTIVNLTLVGPDPRSSAMAVNACLDRMTELEAVLSRFKPDSQLSRLNQVGMVSDIHPAFLTLVKQSLELSRLTDGAFDITVKPLLDLYQATPGVLPTSRQIEQALEIVDYGLLDVSDDRIAFLHPGMSITLDGIAKGFIVDEGVTVLKGLGFENVMVEAGGDLMGLGQKATRSPWKIGVQAPRSDMGSLMATFDVQNQAVATSGDYMQSFTPDFVNHHIIDPRIGHSSPELASASVTALTVAMADGLATAVMVMGRTGLGLIEQMAGYEAFAITKELTELKTSGFQIF
ncbi:MAG: FAD:protein FMN transferase [Chloroflexota bacterium]